MYRTQVASDIIRDGLGLELLKGDDVIAEVFRCDADKTVTIVVLEPVPLREIEALVAEARHRLDPFEDGTPFSSVL